MQMQNNIFLLCTTDKLLQNLITTSPVTSWSLSDVKTPPSIFKSTGFSQCHHLNIILGTGNQNIFAGIFILCK